jgi:hypothetical protein
MKKEEEKEKEISFKDEVIEYFKSLYKRSKEFINNNKIELSILFIVLFLYFLLSDMNTRNTYCSKGGAPLTQQQLQQQQQQLQKQQMQKQQQAYQIKTQIAKIGFSKIANTISSSETLSNVMCYIMSFTRTSITFFSIVFAVMMIPGIPVFGFMLILFALLRTKVADIKSL